MATQQPPLEPDLFSDVELEVASILLDISSLILELDSKVPFEKARWGRKKRRTERKYKFKRELDLAGPTTSSDEEKKIEGEGTASPTTPLSFPNCSSEEKIVTPPVKKFRKPNSHKDRIKEKEEEAAAFKKENEHIKGEILKWQEKLEMLCAMNLYLKDQSSKLSEQAKLGVPLIPVGPTQSTRNMSLIVIRPEQPSLVPPAVHWRSGLEIDLNEEPSDDVAVCAVEGPLTYQADREERAAKSAQARKRRLEIQRERRITSSAHKRPRFQWS